MLNTVFSLVTSLLLAVLPTNTTHVTTGTVTNFYYVEAQDCYAVEFDTEDFGHWVAYDYIAPVGANIVIEFNINDKDDMEDDTIKSITSVMENHDFTPNICKYQ